MESRQLYRYQPFREIWLACNYLLPQGQGIREKIALLLIKLLKNIKGNNNATNNKTREKILILIYLILIPMEIATNFKIDILNDLVKLLFAYAAIRFLIPRACVIGMLAMIAVAIIAIKDIIKILF